MVTITITGEENQISNVLKLMKNRVKRGMITISNLEKKEEKKGIQNKEEKKVIKSKAKK